MRVLLSALVVLVAAQAARAADDPHRLIQRGIELHREASYAASVAALEQARQSNGLGATEQVECSFYLAADYVALGSTQAARRELRAVLEAQPGYELPPYTSPKVSVLFRDVQTELERLPRLRALPPRRKAMNLIELWFEPSRTGGTAFGAAIWRWRGEPTWHEAPLSHVDEKLVTTLEVDRNGTLEYFAEARGPQGLAQAATRERPLELPVGGFERGQAPQPGQIRTQGALTPVVLATTAPPPERRRKSVAGAWWLWSSVGAIAAAGLGVGLYFALRPPTGGTADAGLDFKVQ